MTDRRAVVAFGEMLLRLKSPGAHRLLQKDTLEVCFGGAEFNVLASLQQFGIPCEMVTALPDNELGSAAAQELRRYAIGTRHIQRASGRMGLYFLEAAADIRPGRVLYDRADSSFARRDPHHYNWQSILADARWLHLSGITAALGDGPWKAMLEAAQTAQQMGVSISFDTNMRKSLWAGSTRAPQDAMRPLLELATVIFAGVSDWQICMEGTAPSGSPSDIAHAFLERMLIAYPRAQAVISSVRSSLSAEHQSMTALAVARGLGLVRSRTIDIRKVIDRVGTGDALVAGCLAGLLESLMWRETLDLGVVAGALKHSIPGDVNRCSRAEVEAALSEGRAGRLLR